MKLDFSGDIDTYKAAAEYAMETAGSFISTTHDNMVSNAIETSVNLLGYEGEDAKGAHHLMVQNYETMRLRGPWFVFIYFLIVGGIVLTIFAVNYEYTYSFSQHFCTVKTSINKCPGVTFP